MRVLKFGGTSVGSVESLMNVKKIVEGLSEPAVVVVSALGGLTDKLIATANLAASSSDFHQEMDGIAERHRNIINSVVADDKKAEVFGIVNPLLAELSRIYEGIALLRDLPEKTLETIVSFGERMSAPIVAGMIKGARVHNSLEFIKTEKWFGKNIADTTLTEELIRKEFPADDIKIEITGGFISTDRDSDEITNLGRGGSDYTAALIAATLNSDYLDIWTDVDGFMTADPRIIPTARIIDEMSFIESMELCSFGAKVIYPPTIYPVFHKNIPIRILNTFNPSAPGTLISDHPKDIGLPVKGISAIRDTCLIVIHGKLTRNAAAINSRTYNSMARNGISVFLLAQHSDRDEFSFAVSAKDAREAIKVLNEEFAPELINSELDFVSVIENKATLAVVGENIRDDKVLLKSIFSTLQDNNIPVDASSKGSSQTTLSFVIDSDKANTAMSLIHSLIYSC